MKVSRLIRHFVFDEPSRAEISIGDGARLDPKANCITLAKDDDGFFSTEENIAVRTRVWEPASARAWLTFEVIGKLPKTPENTSPTSLGFRLSDGDTDYFFDAGVTDTWVEVSPTPGNAATGQIVIDDVLSVGPNETFTLTDALGQSLVFEVAGFSGVDPGHIAIGPIVLSGGETVEEITDIFGAAIADAINSQTSSTFQIHALNLPGSGGIVSLFQDLAGVSGNTAIPETLTGVHSVAFSGGTDPTPDTRWSPEADVANHIGAFMLTVNSRKLQVVTNLKTTDRDYAPQVKDLKVLWASDIDAIEDAITRSLLPDMKESIRPRAEIIVTQATAISSFTLALLAPEVAYNIKEVDAVFDLTDDPEKLTDLLSSFAGGTATLASAIPANHKMLVRFLYQPVVAFTTSPDYDEIDKLPSITIRDVKSEGANVRASNDFVVNRSTGEGTVVKAPIQGDLVLRIEWRTEKALDHQRLAGELHRYFSNRSLLRLRGEDEDRRLWLVDEYETDIPPDGDKRGVIMGVLEARVVGVILATQDSIDLPAVQRVVVNLSPL